MSVTKKIRVLLCEFHQESNTFNPDISTASRFNSGAALEGEGVFSARMNSRCAVHGSVDAIEAFGGEVIPTIFMSAPSGGRVADAVLELMKDRVRYYLETSGKIDAVCFALHGATSAETDDDACGALVEYVRGLVGDIPMSASFDLHANITDKVFNNLDYVCGYQTYPHLDFYETGYRAAEFLMRALKGDKLHTASVSIPMLIPPAGYNNRTEPFRSVIETGKQMIADGEIADFTVFPVQPWLDITDICSRVVVIGADTQKLESCAAKLAQMLFDLREDVMPPLMDVDAIIDIAEANTTGKPVLLVDASDSPNGGAVGDSPVVAMRLLERGSKLKTGVFIRDPKTVAQAMAVGVGNSAEFSVGAGFTAGMPGPMKAVGLVKSLHDGFFPRELESRGTGGYIGKSAVIRFGSVDVLVGEVGSSSGDPQLYRHFGIDPARYEMIVIKANTSFLAPYSKISDLVYYADTPGAGASNLKQFRWEHLPKGMYPLDLPEDYKIAAAVVK